jgi:XTP/dITP diphosphohydrolase
MMRQPILLATRSPGKLRELVPLFEGAGLRIVDLAEAGLPETAAENELEQFDSFEENALAKARYFTDLSGMPAIADDSGLVVEALGGQPGVRSKRWSGRSDLSGSALDEANNRRLQEALRRIEDRRARYVCVAAYCAEGEPIICRGETAGRMLAQPRGEGGFGYDPYFYSSELEQTFGEASLAEKQRVSHRGRAFRSLLLRLAVAR